MFTLKYCFLFLFSLFFVLTPTLVFAQIPTPLTITSSSPLPSSTLGTPVSVALQLSGGVGPYTWSATDLPAGLSLDPSTGVISGVPIYSAGGSSFPLINQYTFTVQVYDSIGNVVVKTFDWTLSPTATYSRTPAGNGLFASPIILNIQGIFGVDICPGSDASSYFIRSYNNYWVNLQDPHWHYDSQSVAHTYGQVINDAIAVQLPPGGSRELIATCNNGSYLFLEGNADSPYRFTIASIPVITTKPLLPPATVGAAYSLPLQYILSSSLWGETIEAVPLTWSVVGGSLPTGLSLDSATGVISGIPAVSSLPATFTVQIQDAVGQTSAPVVFSLLEAGDPLTITSSSPLPSSTLGTPVSVALQLSGGVGPYIWSATGLPVGLSINQSTGVISGVPIYTAGGSSLPLTNSYTFTVQVDDSVGGLVTKTFDWTLLPTVTYSRTPSGNGLFASPITLNIRGIFGVDICPGSDASSYYIRSYNNYWVNLQDPHWHYDSPSISRTPGQVIDDTVAVQLPPGGSRELIVTCNNGSYLFLEGNADSPYRFTVASIASIATNPILPPATVGVAYSLPLQYTLSSSPWGETIEAVPLTWGVVGGSLPTGLSLDSATGVISGTPITASLPATFTVQIQDAVGQNSTPVAFTLWTFGPTPNHPPILTPIGNKSVNEHQKLSFQINATDPDAGDSLTFSAPNLPSGATFDPSTATFSWTPTVSQVGDYPNVQFTVTDNGVPAASSTQTIDIKVNYSNPKIVPSLPPATVRVPYSQALQVTGGAAPFVWSITKGVLPNGFSLNAATGVISGTGSAVTTKTFTVQVTDANAKVATTSITFAVQNVLKLTTGSLPGGKVGAAYSKTLAASGGGLPYTWSVIGGALPDGLSLDASTGVISGTPTTFGTSNVTVQVTDSNAQTVSKSYTINITLLHITTGATPAGKVGAAYSKKVVATGGITPYTWSVIAGAVPDGLTLETNTGIISGTSTLAGTYTFTLQVIDADGVTATKDFSITITATKITTAALPNGKVGNSYTKTLTASGGTAPYKWSIFGGTLPNGLKLDSSGNISGIPTTAKTSTVSLRATDVNGVKDTQSFTLKINP